MSRPIFSDSNLSKIWRERSEREQLQRRPAPVAAGIGAAAQLFSSGGSLSCGGGFGAYNPITFTSPFDNIGLTSSGGGTTWSLPFTFNGPNPIYMVTAWLGLIPSLHDGSGFRAWWKGPVNPVLYFHGDYYDSFEFEHIGYGSDSLAYAGQDLTSNIYLLGGFDIVIDYLEIDVAYIGQSS